MDIRQLTYFVSTYKHNSFSAAAKECCVTVQTISKAISNLEQDLNGELLFERKNNGVVPTEFGRAFYPKALEALESFNSAANYIDVYHEQQQPHTKLAIKLCVPDFRIAVQSVQISISFCILQRPTVKSIPQSVLLLRE